MHNQQSKIPIQNQGSWYNQQEEEREKKVKQDLKTSQNN
jgi:hypothetical protein